MRIPMTVTLTDREPFDVNVGFKAQGAAEKQYDFALSNASHTGIRQEWWAYMAWAQSVTDAVYVGPWSQWWDKLDDLTIGAVADDPTGRG